jgi:hypothetical protein
MTLSSKLSIAMTLFLFSFGVQAKTFSNQYCQFELPAGWQCGIEGSEWVCQSENKDRKKEAIIILAAKYRGPQDTLAEYQKYLKDTKTYTLPGGKVQRSEPKYASLKKINAHQWVDALHLASEVPGFYTRYLATVKEDLGVAVTFSVTKDLYSAYQPIFDNVIATLKVFRQKKQNLSNIKMAGGGGDDAPVFGDDLVVDNTIPDISMNKSKKGGSGGGGNDNMLLLAGVGVVALLAALKLKGGKKGAKKKKKKK